MIRAIAIGPVLQTTALALGLAAVAAPFTPSGADAQWVTTYEQFYLQAPHNWEFRDRYQAADRLFNAFDYGHAILYETLWTKPNAPASVLEEKEYDHLTKKVLVKPPRLPLEEGAIEIAYVQLAPEAKQMFEWAHILHRQLYDVLADERLSQAKKDAEVARLLAYYKTRPDAAFSSRPKSMELMQEQPYSLAFRQQYPKFNGLIWAYHWLQVGLYEPLLVNNTVEARQAGVRATVSRFWQMLENPTETMPYQMPMTAAVAPAFAARYPEAAIIFDNLHSMHDVVSDILANDSVSRDRKRAEIVRAGRLFRDDTSYVMPVEAWRTMSREMGVENMGGPAVGFTPKLPEKTVTYGAVMEHDERTGRMIGMKVGEMTGAHAGMQHGAAAGPDSGQMDHPRMNMPATGDTTRRDSLQQPMDHAAMGHDMAGMAGMDSTMMANMMQMHMRMMADPVVRERMMADTTMRRMMTEMMEHMPAEHREAMERMMREAPAARRGGGATPPRPRARPAQPRAQPSTKPADPHAGHGQPPRRAPKPAPKPEAKPADPHAGHGPPR
ncbi:MAG: hypothetical protein M3373_02105 [Gemmatimonadota bacterium]|nr:hypothetical protein [Gemmatimonadota bacterium]